MQYRFHRAAQKPTRISESMIMTTRNNTKPQNYQAVRMELNIETMKGWASGGYVDTPFDTADEMCEAGMVAADLLVMG